MKQCKKCRQSKARSNFYTFKRGKNKGKLYWYCKNCCKRENDNAYKAQQHSWRVRNLENSFGLTIEQYDVMLAAQNGLCKICGKPETAKRNGVIKRLAVDHDHNTGTIRGLLCASCNIGLGKFYDNPVALDKAAQYLRETVQKQL